MTSSIVSASLTPSPFPTTFTVNTSVPKNQTSSQAVNIGNLAEQGDVVSVSDSGTTSGVPVSTTFTAQAGDVSTLANSFSNIVTQGLTHLQLFDSSGNIIADNPGSAAQQAAYQQWVSTGLTLNSDAYTATATPLLGSTALAMSASEQQGTSLSVKSQLTAGDPSEFYNFSLSGNNLKLAFDAGAATPSARVQILNSKGGVIADSAGNPYQRANYQAITSGTGLSASSGNYSVKVSYANGADISKNVNYNFQLYSGSSYAVVYQSNVKAQPGDNSAAGSVTPTSDAQLYTRSALNTISQTPASAINIGWLQENKSTLAVYSQLTSVDNTDYYSFTLQQGNNLKLGFDAKNTQNLSGIDVQIMNSSGTMVIADNNGTAAQKAAYQSLTTSNGLQASAGNYIVKVSYAPNAPKQTSNYGFNVYSGTGYSAEYKTTSSAQTYGNALLLGNLPGSTTASSGIAAYLTGAANGATPGIMSVLSLLA